jgi:chorismate dehydratase
MRRIRLGAVGYLNARPLVFGLDRLPQFDLRYDVPSECARLLHARDIDVGLIPSIEYVRDESFRIVPDLAIASRGQVRSVALYIKRPISDVRSIVMDTGSRTSVALVRVLCERMFKIRPAIDTGGPDLPAMLARADAALVIGDNALLDQPSVASLQAPVEKIDLGDTWTKMTGLPFVWAFWAGRENALGAADVHALQSARDAGVKQPERIARDYFRGAPQHQALGAQYLRDNIKYYLGHDERAGLELFYRCAAEAGLAPNAGALRFYESP